ncbi:hypothetical protein ETAA8_62940 [Anatilimnocola aggregata]|uniref:Uncharacterized protein n=1 Tax=Anatilimnocola aggregata TaxID=2528021 RepID=A0A517YLP2_9BACT|nr:hypothetical protein ETAA8_62940 [Anatilimnocola aggregata]
MIMNDAELAVTQDRIAWLQKLLVQLRVTARSDEYPLVASGYLSEVEKMQSEVLVYLRRHSSQSLQAAS